MLAQPAQRTANETRGVSPSRRSTTSASERHRRRTWSTWPHDVKLVAAAVFFAPFPTLRVPGINFTVTDALLVLALILALHRSSRAGPGVRRRDAASGYTNPRSLTPYYLGLGALLTGLGASSVTSSLGGWDAIAVMVQYAMTYGVLIPLVFVVARDNDLTSAAVAGISASILVAIALREVGPFGSTVRSVVPGLDRVVDFSRFSAMFGNPNAAAKALSVCLPVLAMCWLGGRLRAPRALACLLLWAWAVFASASAGGLATFLFSTAMTGLGLLLAVGSIGRWIRRAVGIALLLAVFITPILMTGGSILPDRFQERILEPASESDDLTSLGSGDEKRDRAVAAWENIGRHPILGVGAGHYRDTLADDSQVHNTYLLLWAEGGILALLGMALLLPSILLESIWRALSSSGMARGTFFLAVTAILATAIAAITNTHMYRRESLLILAVAVGTAWGRSPRGSAIRNGISL